MTNTDVSTHQSILDSGLLSRTRRNHGLEHATLHVLSKQFPGRTVAGHSDPRGFWVLGNFSLEEMQTAVDEALSRLQNGEKNLAVHPNCGTNFVVSGILAGLAASAAMLGVGNSKREKLERLPFAAMFATIALIFSQPLAMRFQEKVTTSGKPGALRVVSITTTSRGKMIAHRIITEG